MKQLYGGVKGYDFEEEYGIILRTIEHEKEKLNNHPRYNDVFRGLNLVSKD
jgi:SP family general alpha glucoside:H+ symporter-like MFS transporter